MGSSMSLLDLTTTCAARDQVTSELVGQDCDFLASLLVSFTEMIKGTPELCQGQMKACAPEKRTWN